ncbi:hypothetical protein CXB51_005166 [Gossypium anomalum]|uniref:Uncharacterized protein n=1 Tax=Gossypium anomalum TaxID=47600 RepID=A0A8J5Z0M5_9ROSI|nr:hypothetical protein CXB51_005166 [Gossypium anomalum]
MQLNDKELAKELYKKYSAVADTFLFILFRFLILCFRLVGMLIICPIIFQQIHGRKLRDWQMICVLSQFVDDDIVGEVTQCL